MSQPSTYAAAVARIEQLESDLRYVRVALQLGDKPIPAGVAEHMRVFSQRTDDMFKLREALAPLATCANEYYAEAPQGTQLDTTFYLAQARKAAAAMGWPTHMPRATPA